MSARTVTETGLPADRVRIDPSGCWLWTGSQLPSGYGTLRVKGKPNPGRKGSGIDYAHRVSYRTVKGEIPPRYQVDHLCGVKACVNPDHLEAVTPSVNALRSIAARRLAGNYRNVEVAS